MVVALEVIMVITVGDCITVVKTGSLVRWVICTGRTDPNTHVAPGEHGPQSRSREPRADGVDPPLAAATLNGDSLNLTGVNGAWIFGVCWENRGRAGVRMDIATNEEKEEYEEIRKEGKAK